MRVNLAAIALLLVTSSCGKLLGISDLVVEDGSGGSLGTSFDAGGASGSAIQPGICRSDLDCGDGLLCNGVERCVDGTCRAGAPYCNNPDFVECEALCSEGNPLPTCSVRGRDRDGDGHASARCTFAKGGDCADDEPEIHPLAVEICDSRDNDCDGKLDVADGLSLGGTTKRFATGSAPSIAWSNDAQVYGVVWQDTAPLPKIRLSVLTSTGEPLVHNELVAPANVEQTAPMITWGGNAFGITWAEKLNNQSMIRFARVDAQGRRLEPGPPIPFPSAAELAPAPLGYVAGDWIVAVTRGLWPNYNVILYAISGTTWTTKSELNLQRSAAQPRLVVSGAFIGLTTRGTGVDDGLNFISRTLYRDGFIDTVDNVRTQQLTVIPGAKPQLADIIDFDGRYTILWSNVFPDRTILTKIETLSLDPRNNLENCGRDHRVSLSNSEGTEHDLYSTALVRYPQGVAAAARTQNGMGFFTFGTRCPERATVLEFSAADGPRYPPALGYADSRFVLLWEEGNPADDRWISYRIFSESLCGDP